MKYALIPFIALGLVLSLAIAVEYHCEGQEMFPIYYGSPVVFKQKSLGSSMEYFYSISGLIINILVWGFVLYLFDKFVQTLISKFSKPKLLHILYKVVIGLMIVFTTLNIVVDSAMIGTGFGKGLNYWYWDMDKEAKDWGMKCKGELTILKK